MPTAASLWMLARRGRPTESRIFRATGSEPTAIPCRKNLPASSLRADKRLGAALSWSRRGSLSLRIPTLATFFDIGANIPGGLPFKPEAAELKKSRMADDNRDNPDANCLPMGLTQFHMQPQPRKIVQTPGLIVILYEANYGLRYIYTDGRQLPPQGEPQPWWYGYSVGHWEGDTLVVETNNLRGAETGPHDGWLDVRGSPYSEEARFTERFRRPVFGKLEIDVTVDDPKFYTKPFTVRINQRFLSDEEPIEFVCNENQQFRQRIKVD
jgi:hypothetical protein